GEVRDLAVGTEVRIRPRAFARAGFRMNTLGNEPGGHAPTFSVGGSYAALSSLWIDAQATVGSESASRGWGVAARVALCAGACVPAPPSVSISLGRGGPTA